MVDDTSPHGGHGGASVNHQEDDNGRRQHSTRLFRVGGSRRVRALARNRSIRINPLATAHAQAMADGANGQRVAIPPAGPINPPAGVVNPPAGPINLPAGPVIAIANAGAPPAVAPAFQGFDIDAAFLDPPLRKSQVGPIFHSVAQPLPW